MDCDTFRDRLLSALPDELDLLRSQHACYEPACREAADVAVRTAGPLAEWRASRERLDGPPRDFAARTVARIAEEAAPPRRSKAVASRVRRFAGPLTAAAAVTVVAALLSGRPADLGMVRELRTTEAVTLPHADPKAVASVEKVERWLAAAAEGEPADAAVTAISDSVRFAALPELGGTRTWLRDRVGIGSEVPFIDRLQRRIRSGVGTAAEPTG